MNKGGYVTYSHSCLVFLWKKYCTNPNKDQISVCKLVCVCGCVGVCVGVWVDQQVLLLEALLSVMDMKHYCTDKTFLNLLLFLLFTFCLLTTASQTSCFLLIYIFERNMEAHLIPLDFQSTQWDCSNSLVPSGHKNNTSVRRRCICS